MAKKKLLQDFAKKALQEAESKQVKGGRSYVPSNTGSYGFINWDDVDIRESGLVGTKGTASSIVSTGDLG